MRQVTFAALLEPAYAEKKGKILEIRGWTKNHAMRAGLELLLACPADLADEIVNSQKRGSCPVDKGIFSPGLLVEPHGEKRYDVKQVKAERGPQKKKWTCLVCGAGLDKKPAIKTELDPGKI